MVISRSVPFYCCIAFIVLSLGLAAVVNAKALILLLPLVVAVVYFSQKKFEWVLFAFFFLIPFFGEIQERLMLKAVPLEFFFIFGAGLGGLWRKNQDAAELAPYLVPKPVVLFLSSLLLSLVVGITRSFTEYFSTDDLRGLGHHLGWVFLFFLIPISGFLLYLWVTGEHENRPKYFKYLVFLLCGIFLSSIAGLIQYMGIWKADMPVPGRYDGTFIDANAMGVVAGLLLPLWIAPFFDREKRRILFLGPSLFFLLFIAGSRSAILISLVASVIFLCLLESKKRKIIAIFIFTLGIIFTLFLGRIGSKGPNPSRTHTFTLQLQRFARVGFWTGFSRIRDNQRENEHLKDDFSGSFRDIINDRPLLWKAGWITFKRHWLFGTGIGRYLMDMPKYAGEIGQTVNDNSCNMYLHIAAEQGIIGLALFLMMIGHFLWRFLQNRRKGEYIQMAGFSAIIGLTASFVFGAHLLNAEVNSLFWFLLAMVSCSERRKTERAMETTT